MKTTSGFKQMKKQKDPIVMMTSYDYPSARIVEEAGVDMILVGDSLGMVVLGYESTVPVTLDDMVLHTKAVKRGAKDTFIVTDMPFMTYHSSVTETMKHAKQLVQQGGAHAVKLEGAGDVVNMIDKLTKAGIPVMGHLGLTPQSVNVLGGYKVQGKEIDDAKKLIQEAKSIEEAGAFAIVLECVPQQLATKITEELTIPTIGIGAGNKTDGQVLVYHDVIGYGVSRVPKFVKQYTNVTEPIRHAVLKYINEVKTTHFPEEVHRYNMKDDAIELLYGGK